MTTTPSPPNDPSGAEELTGETLEPDDGRLTPVQEAAAFWGAATNAALPVDDRLACALKALEHYGRTADYIPEDEG